MDLPELIRHERRAKGWSMRDLARFLDVSHGAVAQWESGATKPTIVNLLDMFMLFGISASELKSAGSPFAGQLVDDAQELALLGVWRRLEPQDRAIMLRLLTGRGFGAVLPKNVAPEKSRKKNNG